MRAQQSENAWIAPQCRTRQAYKRFNLPEGKRKPLSFAGIHRCFDTRQQRCLVALVLPLREHLPERLQVGILLKHISWEFQSGSKFSLGD